MDNVWRENEPFYAAVQHLTFIIYIYKAIYIYIGSVECVFGLTIAQLRCECVEYRVSHNPWMSGRRNVWANSQILTLCRIA